MYRENATLLLTGHCKLPKTVQRYYNSVDATDRFQLFMPACVEISTVYRCVAAQEVEGLIH